MQLCVLFNFKDDELCLFSLARLSIRQHLQLYIKPLLNTYFSTY